MSTKKIQFCLVVILLQLLQIGKTDVNQNWYWKCTDENRHFVLVLVLFDGFPSFLGHEDFRVWLNQKNELVLAAFAKYCTQLQTLNVMYKRTLYRLSRDPDGEFLSGRDASRVRMWDTRVVWGKFTVLPHVRLSQSTCTSPLPITKIVHMKTYFYTSSLVDTYDERSNLTKISPYMEGITPVDTLSNVHSAQNCVVWKWDTMVKKEITENPQSKLEQLTKLLVWINSSPGLSYDNPTSILDKTHYCVTGIITTRNGNVLTCQERDTKISSELTLGDGKDEHVKHGEKLKDLHHPHTCMHVTIHTYIFPQRQCEESGIDGRDDPRTGTSDTVRG